MGQAVSCFDSNKNGPNNQSYSWAPDDPSASAKKASFDGRKRSMGSRKIVGVGGSAHTVERPSADPLPSVKPPVTEPKKLDEEKPLLEHPSTDKPLETPPLTDHTPENPSAVVPETELQEPSVDPDANVEHVMTAEEEAKVDAILDGLNASEELTAKELAPEEVPPHPDVDVIAAEVVVAEVTVTDVDPANGLDADPVPDSDPVVEVEKIELVAATVVADITDSKDELTSDADDQLDAEHPVDSITPQVVATPDPTDEPGKTDLEPATEVIDIDPVSGIPIPEPTTTDRDIPPNEQPVEPPVVPEHPAKPSSEGLDNSEVQGVDVSELSSIDTRRAMFDRAEDRLPEVREVRRDVLDPVTNELISLEEYRQRQMERAQGVVRERVEKFEGIDEERSRQIAEHNAIEAARTEAIVKATWTFKRRKGTESTPEKSPYGNDLSLGSPASPPTTSEKAALEPVGMDSIDDIDEPVAVEHLGDILPTKENREEETSIPDRMRSINAYSFDDHADSSPKEPEEPQPV